MDSPIDFFKKVILEAAEKNASSVHLSAASAPLLRVNGRFLPEREESEILKKEDLEKITFSFLSEEERKILAGKKELTTVKEFGEGFRFRVKVFYQKDCLSLSLNYISEEIMSLEKIGLPQALRRNLEEAAGLLIVAGPSASGKTSTAAGIIEDSNKNKRKYIITLEDPIEKVFASKKSVIVQRQIGRDVAGFLDGLKHCLEEDADIVYIDEIRENFGEALPYILELASGNCLVILEMSAENSVRALEKMLNANCRDLTRESVHFMLADVLSGIIVQRLIPNRENGLSLALEILLSNFAVKSLIREGGIYQLENVMHNSSEEGMISMEKSIKDLVISGEVDRQEAGKEIEI
jgi:twitching motility protein PilT